MPSSTVSFLPQLQRQLYPLCKGRWHPSLPAKKHCYGPFTNLWCQPQNITTWKEASQKYKQHKADERRETSNPFILNSSQAWRRCLHPPPWQKNLFLFFCFVFSALGRRIEKKSTGFKAIKSEVPFIWERPWWLPTDPAETIISTKLHNSEEHSYHSKKENQAKTRRPNNVKNSNFKPQITSIRMDPASITLWQLMFCRQI